ncbi:ATP-binding SpoIIE family protein phosphatase [Isoptericola jiangsuensis]|uniref:ATP-binding SpoIIE family protein phosphatase n=1 Tax=Isoptericola jiangsuensis TaxID=548579 RepID=UPI003AACF6EF
MTGVVDPEEPGRVLENGAWYTLDHPSAVGGVRRAAAVSALHLGFGESRAAEIGLVVSELATNQTRHAGGGSVLIRVQRSASAAALEVLAVDGGPGMRDVTAAMRDGVSSRGTLGIGLGTLPRLTTAWDAWSSPGLGTVVAASFSSPGGAPGLDRTTGITRAMTGQQVCGDAHAERDDDGVRTLMVADGLGHGPLAAAASQAAVRTFLDAPLDTPATILRHVHRALGGTRGAAVAIAQLRGSTLHHAGLGNIAGTLHGARSRSLLSQPGIAGSHAPSLQETALPVSPGDVVTLFSDGLTNRVDLGAYPGLATHVPLVVAGVLMRDLAVRPDDACVAVLPVWEAA